MPKGKLKEPKEPPKEIAIPACIQANGYLTISYESQDDYSHESSYRHIREVKITNVDLGRLTDEFVHAYNYQKDLARYEKARYFLRRVLTIGETWSPEAWEHRVRRGYYGDEDVDFYLRDDWADEVHKHVEWYNKEAPDWTEVVEYLLVLEYGYLRPDLIGRDWHLLKLPASAVSIPNQVYYRKMSRRKIYKDYDGIVCCTYDHEGNQVLVDGYNRLCSKSPNDIIKLLHARKR